MCVCFSILKTKHSLLHNFVYGIRWELSLRKASQVALVVKKPLPNAGEARERGSIPGFIESQGSTVSQRVRHA